MAFVFPCNIYKKRILPCPGEVYDCCGKNDWSKVQMEQRRADVTSRAVRGGSTTSITIQLQSIISRVICKNTTHIKTIKKRVLYFRYFLTKFSGYIQPTVLVPWLKFVEYRTHVLMCLTWFLMIYFTYIILYCRRNAQYCFLSPWKQNHIPIKNMQLCNSEGIRYDLYQNVLFLDIYFTEGVHNVFLYLQLSTNTETTPTDGPIIIAMLRENGDFLAVPLSND